MKYFAPIFCFSFSFFIISFFSCNGSSSTDNLERMVITPVMHMDKKGIILDVRYDTTFQKSSTDNNPIQIYNQALIVKVDDILPGGDDCQGEGRKIYTAVDSDGNERVLCGCEEGLTWGQKINEEGYAVRTCSKDFESVHPDYVDDIEVGSPPSPPNSNGRITSEDCDKEKENCIKEAKKKQDKILKDQLEFAIEQIRDFKPCHSRTPESIAGDLKYYYSPGFKDQLLGAESGYFPCTDQLIRIHFGLPSSTLGHPCYRKYFFKALEECLHGAPGQNRTIENTQNATEDLNLIAKGIDIGKSDFYEISQQNSVSYPNGTGLIEIAQAKVFKSIEFCHETHGDCIAKAENISPMVVKHVPTPKEIIAQIDQTKLDFKNNNSSGSILGKFNPFSKPGPFKGLGPQDLESRDTYMGRLAFLKAYSAFLNKSNLQKEQVNNLNSLMRQVQSQYNELLNQYTTTIILIVLNEWGNNNSQEINSAIWPDLNSYSKLLILEKNFRESVKSILSIENYKLFLESGWPGTHKFVTLQPMNIPQKLAPKDEPDSGIPVEWANPGPAVKNPID